MTQLHPLDQLATSPIDPAQLRQVVRDSTLYVWSSVPRGSGLGTTVQDPDLLHFPIEDEAQRAWMVVPAFTARRHMHPSIERNPEWRKLTIVEVAGAELLAHLRPGLMLVVNPWTDHELRLPGS